MSIIAKTPQRVMEKFQIEYPFLNLELSNVSYHKLGRFLVIMSDVRTSDTLPVAERIYRNFIIGMFPERRSTERRV